MVVMAMIALSVAASRAANSAEGARRCLSQCEKISFLAFAFSLAFSTAHFATAEKPLLLFHGAVVYDRFAALSGAMLSVMGLYTTFVAARDSRKDAAFRCEFYPLLMLATAGAAIMGMGGDLFVIIIGVEILSLATYSMVALERRNRRAVEGAFKYFLMGAAASAVFLFGAAHIYGACGTTTLSGVGAALLDPAVVNKMFLPAVMGIAFVMVAMLFKLAAVPFHMWAPDVYDGASVPMAAFMTYFVKAAGFITLFRMVATAFFPLLHFFAGALSFVAVATMTFANIAALMQHGVKRMLAYSSVSHTGYIMIAVLALRSADPATACDAGAALLFYLAAYFFINLGLFSALTFIEPADGDVHAISDFEGIGFRRPLLSFSVALGLFALAGLPATAGFTAKLFVFMSGFAANYPALVLFALINSLVAFYYYTRIVVAMYMQKAAAAVQATQADGHAEAAFCIIFSMALVAAMGVFPWPFMYVTRLAAAGLFGI